MLRKKNLIYQGRSVKKFNEIRDLLDIYRVKYTYQVKDTVNDAGSDSLLSFLGRQQGMAPRAFTGSAGISGEDLKNYMIYAYETDIEEKVLKSLWEEVCQDVQISEKKSLFSVETSFLLLTNIRIMV